MKVEVLLKPLDLLAYYDHGTQKSLKSIVDTFIDGVSIILFKTSFNAQEIAVPYKIHLKERYKSVFIKSSVNRKYMF